MISIKRFLDGSETAEPPTDVKGPVSRRAATILLPAMTQAYGSALAVMGRSSVEACPAMGRELESALVSVAGRLSLDETPQAIAAGSQTVRERLEDWGRRVARHYQEKVGEVKDILMVMARTVESVGQRDRRYALQMNEVTVRLKSIASLDDLNVIRVSIEKSASELKESVNRMTAEGKAVLDELKAEVSTYQVKLEAAQEIALRDSLTGLRNRLWIEGEIERRIHIGAQFCAAILDLDDFKSVNDIHGHLAGDALLRQFATELRSACRFTDIIGRWGGDEFILLLESDLSVAAGQIERLAKWICGSYKIEGSVGPREIRINASIGLAEYRPGETMEQLLDRADAAMYRQKAATRGEAGVDKR
jgi:diguanylate cyclase (GGDEF)-like protein